MAVYGGRTSCCGRACKSDSEIRHTGFRTGEDPERYTDYSGEWTNLSSFPRQKLSQQFLKQTESTAESNFAFLLVGGLNIG